MKKFTLSFFILLVIALLSNSYGQKRVTTTADRSASTQDFRKVQFGLGLGVNSSSIAADWDEFYRFTSAAKVGVNLGAYLKIRPAKIFAIQFGVQVSSKGMNADEDEDLDFDVTINMNYLEIPIMFKFYFVKGLNFEFGPNIGILATSSFYIDDEEWEDFQNGYSPLDLALGFGLNYEFSFGLAAGLHFDVGTSNINNEFLDNWSWEGDFDRTDFPMKTRTLRLNVFYYF